jgi:hypothetical protein
VNSATAEASGRIGNGVRRFSQKVLELAFPARPVRYFAGRLFCNDSRTSAKGLLLRGVLGVHFEPLLGWCPLRRTNASGVRHRFALRAKLARVEDRFARLNADDRRAVGFLFS